MIYNFFILGFIASINLASYLLTQTGFTTLLDAPVSLSKEGDRYFIYKQYSSHLTLLLLKLKNILT